MTAQQYPLKVETLARIAMVIASVEVPEGTRIMTRIVGCAPEEVRIGMPVRAPFERLDDDVALLQFEPAR